MLTGRSKNQRQESHKNEKKAKDGTGDSHGGLLGNTSISLFAFSHAEHRYNGLQVERGFLLDIVIRQSAAVFKLLAGEDKALLVGGALELCKATRQYVNPCFESDAHGA